ncbi:hypothetical protein [Sphingobacterium spiritivorum]|uniref:hypothetical protein n=1 Tax=Sphingobacterium spiritivorum TaxID=258 RepID=UPI000E0FE079|nr:hypothetical protein [Sphingobacterium spiritivorum]
MEKIESLAAETLLQRGVKVQITAPLLFRLFRKKNIALSVYQPSLGNKIRISALYLKMGIKEAELQETTHENAEALLVKYSHTLLRIVAICMFKGCFWPWLLNRPVAVYLKWKLTPQRLFALVHLIVLFSGTTDFMNTIRSVKTMKVTEPIQSQNPKRS